ncbi:BON domain-containing protein [Azoarcus indigens]|uniref:BON domain-containing protein n=1 Tax=Azoarcus indigens TaxID=29545 RepID=A0A4R6E3S6_9RHOO|nr:BON domain-containing protein [Azoarcus indigens]NMG64635.1 BON domain-containing protein [Azoarcus indigens]TDN52463.1 BON domain-containing protein [Azoarcus indigens]
MRITRTHAIVLAATLPLLLVDIATAAAPKRAGSCEVRNEDINFFRDNGLTVKLSSKLQFNKVLLREKINAKVTGGVAMLSGRVSSRSMVELAGSLAADTGGIRCVQNYLEVGPPLPEAERPV